MLKNLLKGIVIAGTASLFLVSCTVSEPDAPSGNPEALRLKALSSYGVTLMSIDYDSQNRVTAINYGNEETYEFTYQGNSRVPVEIVNTEYEEIWDDNSQKDVRGVSGIDTWTDIRATADGCYIASCTSREWQRNSDDANATLVTYMTFLYDSDGHLTHTTETDNEGTLGREYNWQDGLLKSWTDTDDQDVESAKYEYSDIDNVNLQWDPNNGMLGPLSVTGLFGKAPSKFFKSEETFFRGQRDGYAQYAYTLLDNGLIHASKLNTGDDGTMFFNFVYEKKQ